jgi:hypothetical protein
MSIFDPFYPEDPLEEKFLGEIHSVTRSFILNLVRKAHLPKTIYHYTNMAGFQGIIDSGMVWATHLAYMNDFSEYLHAVNVAGNISRELKDRETQETKKLFYNAMEEILHPTRVSIADYPPIFIACFSEAEDDLSQWRAYGRGEGGVSLGFDAESLKSHIGERALFAPVIYDPEVQDKIIKDFLEASANLYLKHVVETGDESREFFERWYLQWRGFASQLAPVFKNRTFRDEREWRIIYALNVDSLEFVHFRSNKAFVTPFIKLKLGVSRSANDSSNAGHTEEVGNIAEDRENVVRTERQIPDILTLNKIWIGPNKSMRLAHYSACCLLERYEYEFDRVEIEYSSVPYRVS